MAAILEAREQRAARQAALLQQYQKPLICFTMNIAGPVKTGVYIQKGFEMGKDRIWAQLAGAGAAVVWFEETISAAGYSAFYAVDREAVTLKRLMTEIEDASPLGRLFDMDVVTPDGRKVERQSLGYPRRKCLICGQDAVLCSRSRTHSAEQLQAETQRILREAVIEDYSRRVASAAVRSLLYEVCTTPKPGLVDRHNNGSHRDMDIFTFMSGGSALWPYFRDCVAAGAKSSDASPEETFRQLRLLGRGAEQTMYRATGGVNTHKGAIFTLGLMCGGVGRLLEKEPFSETDILAQCRAMAKGIVQNDLGVSGPMTNGRKLYANYGITGIRGEAEMGFPAVAEVGLPTLREGLAKGLSVNDAGCAALLAIMAHTTDTNLISRGGREVQQEICGEIRQLLRENPYPEEAVLNELDARFIRENLSPGGSADLLAATYFLHFITASEDFIRVQQTKA